MMNIALLFDASEYLDNDLFYSQALTHAATTLKNHIRPDNTPCGAFVITNEIAPTIVNIARKQINAVVNLGKLSICCAIFNEELLGS